VNVTSDYRATPITVCPNNNTHVINPDGIIPLDSTSIKSVAINQNSVIPTGQHYLADFFELSIPAGTGATATYNISYDYNVSAYSITVLPTSDNVGDSFDVITVPNTLAGTITSAIDVGATSLVLSSVANLSSGFLISISDGTTTNDLGWIISVDATTNTIIVSTATSSSFDIGANVTYGIPRIRNGKIVNSQNFGLGFSTIGSSGLPAGAVAQLNYTNHSADAKILVFYVELQF
jgi:hypothetical protein